MKRFFACVGFTAAVTLIALNLADVFYAYVICSGAAVMLITTLILPKYRQERVFPVCFSTVIFVCILYVSVYHAEVLPSQLLGYKEAQSTFYLTSLAQERNGSFIYTAKTQSIVFAGAPQKITVIIKSDEPIYADAYKLLKGNLKFYSLSDNAFSSFGYWGKRIYLSARVESYEVTDIKVNELMRRILSLREDIITTLFLNVKGDEGALSAALITGEKSLMSDQAYNSFKAAGISHLMAVSGLHLTVMTGAFMLILNALRIRKRISSAILIVTVFFYCALAGFTSSIVRAGIMLTVILFGDIIKKRSDTLNSLGLAVFIICLNPFAVTDAGAVLSVLAVLALIVSSKVLKIHYNAIYSFMRKLRIRSAFLSEVLKYIAKSFIVSACILIITLPAMYIFFGYFSVICIFINIFIIPLGSASTVLSLITFFACKSGMPFGIVISLDRGLNSFILFLVKTAASYSFTIIRTEFYFGFVMAAILLLFGICFIIGKRGAFRAVAVFSVIALILTSVLTFSYDKSRAQLYVTENGAVAVVDKGEAVVLGVSNKSDYYAIRSFLSIREAEIDFIAVKGDEENCLLLAEEFGSKTVISEEFSKEILKSESVSEYITENEYQGRAGNIAFEVSYSDGFKYNLSVNGISINNIKINKNSIFVARKAIYDYNGIINLENGDVIYSIYRDSSYKARWLSAWQS